MCTSIWGKYIVLHKVFLYYSMTEDPKFRIIYINIFKLNVNQPIL